MTNRRAPPLPRTRTKPGPPFDSRENSPTDVRSKEPHPVTIAEIGEALKGLAELFHAQESRAQAFESRVCAKLDELQASLALTRADVDKVRRISETTQGDVGGLLREVSDVANCLQGTVVPRFAEIGGELKRERDNRMAANSANRARIDRIEAVVRELQAHSHPGH